MKKITFRKIIKATTPYGLIVLYRYIKEKRNQDNCIKIKEPKKIEKDVMLNWTAITKKTNYDKIDFTDIEFYDNNILENIEENLLGKVDETNYNKNEMSHEDRAFLNGIIRKTKPKTIVEIGVSAGGSSCVILNAIRDMSGAKLYSFDYNTIWYRDKNDRRINGRKTGFLINQIVPDFAGKQHLHTGGVPCKYFHVLPETGVDICFIDTVHENPGEHLNILEILPRMRKNGIIIYHDTAYHISPKRLDGTGTTNHISVNTLNGKRILLKPRAFIPNIGAIILDENIENMLFPLFANISLPWLYKITCDDFAEMLKHFLKYYPKDLVQIFVYYYHFYTNDAKKDMESAKKIAREKTTSWLQGEQSCLTF